MTTATNHDPTICKWCEEEPATHFWTDEHNGACAVCDDCNGEMTDHERRHHVDCLCEEADA